MGDKQRIEELKSELDRWENAARDYEQQLTMCRMRKKQHIAELEARVAEAEALNEQQAEAIQEYRDRQMEKDYAECIQERDCYRKALERIANYNPPEMMSHKVWRWRINWLREKAQNALDAKKGGGG